MEYLRQLSDKELWDKLNQAELAEKILNDPAWALLKEAGNRIVDRALQKFSMAMKADDLVGIIETQLIIKKYKYGLLDELEQLKVEAEYIEEEILGEAQNREMTNPQSPA